MNSKRFIIYAALLLGAFQITGAFNTYMKFNAIQSWIGSAFSSAILLVAYIQGKKYYKNRSSDA